MANDFISRESALDFMIPTYDLNISAQDERALGDRFEKFLESIPAADVRPVVRGRWEQLDESEKYKCSNCERIMWFSKRLSISPDEYKFCPNCGADMRNQQILKDVAQYGDTDVMMPAT